MEEARRFVESKRLSDDGNNRLLFFILSQAHSKHRTDKGGRYCGCVSLYHRALCATANRNPAFDAIFSRSKRYKATHLTIALFGIICKRNEKELIMHSGLMCLDFDHVENIVELKQQLLNHEYFDTELLFVSPSGNGLKWIIPVDLKGWEHSRYFKAVANCIKATGLPLVDMSGSDVARSCFLPYDPQAYINPKYKDDVEENIFRPRLGECPF